MILLSSLEDNRASARNNAGHRAALSSEEASYLFEERPAAADTAVLSSLQRFHRVQQNMF